MKAYWYDNQPVSFTLYSIDVTRQQNAPKKGDQRAPHDSGREVTGPELSSLGVLYRFCPQVSDVDALASERGYKNRDEVTVSPQTMGSVYEEKVKMFFAEHLHEDEEIRYILDGEGFFDVRSSGDEWVRIRLGRGDLIVLPAGIYHRFTTDEGNVSLPTYIVYLVYRVVCWFKGKGVLMFIQFVKAMRLFQDEPKWTPLNRGPEVDGNPHRKTYLDTVLKPVAA